MDGQKKNYRMTFMGEFDVHVEVDHAVLTDEKLREYLEANFDVDDLIADHGSLFNAFLDALCREIMMRSVSGLHVSDAFDNRHVEGYPPLDGTEGITLITYDYFDFYGAIFIQEETDDENRPGN